MRQLIFFGLFISTLHAQDTCLQLPDTLFVCGFETEIPATAFPSQWTLLCEESPGTLAADVTVSPNQITVSECGAYLFSFTGTTPACTAVDTLLIYFDDPSSLTFSAQFSGSLEYNDYGCHGGGSGCTSGAQPGVVSIGGATPPSVAWNFSLAGQCVAQNYYTEIINPVADDCLAEAISVAVVQTSDADTTSVVFSQQYGFENYFALQDSLYAVYLNDALGSGCTLENPGCPSICIDNPDQDGPLTVIDTIIRILPFRTGGNWSLLTGDTCLILEDTTVFDYFNNTTLRLSVEPGADYYGPGDIEWTLEQQYLFGSDTVFSDISSSYYLTVQWKEFFVYDTITEYRERIVEDLLCQGCGGTTFLFTDNVPTAPTYDCGPVGLEFIGDFCDCFYPFVDVQINSQLNCAGGAETIIFTSENGFLTIYEPSGGFFDTNTNNQLTTAYLAEEEGNYFVDFMTFDGCFTSTSFTITGDFTEFFSEFSETICEGDCYDWNGASYCESGTYEQVFSAQSNSCDSTVVLTLTVEEGQQSTTDFMTICEGECAFWNEQQYCTAGTYSIETQENNCFTIQYLELEVEQNFFVSIQASSALDCENETVTLTAFSQSQEFIWSNGASGNTIVVTEPGSYFVTAISPSGCESEAFTAVIDASENTVIETSAVICENDCYDWNGTIICEAGIYENVVQNGNCSETEILELTTEAAPQIEILNVTALDCQNGTAQIVISDENATYTWSNGATGAAISVTEPGEYTVSAISALGCESTASVTVADASENTVIETSAVICENDCYDWNGTIICEAGIYENVVQNGNCSETEILELTTEAAPQIEILNVTALDCQNGTAQIVISDENATYTWSNGATGAAISVTEPGEYTVSAISALGCESTASVTVADASENTVIETSAVMCENDCYDWNGTIICEAGIYENVLQNGNCSETEILELITEAAPQIEITASGILDCENETVILSAETPGGTITWSDGTSGNTLSTSEPGMYVAAVVSENGCESTAEFNLEENTEIISLPPNTVEDISCATGVATLDLPQYAGYEYLWTTSENVTVSTQSSPEFSEPGTYSLVMTNSQNGCTDDLQLEVLPQSEIAAFTTASATCADDSDGVIILENPVGGNAPYLFSIDGTTWQTEPVFTDLPVGNYSVQVTDADECTTEISTEVAALSVLPDLNFELDFTICGNESVILDAALPAAANAVYLWENGHADSRLSVEAAGNYSVSVSNECSTEEAVFTVTRTQNGVYVPNVFSPTGASDNQIFRPFFNAETVSCRLEIFDRWGSPVFVGTDCDTGWDGNHKGNEAAAGVYIWHLTAVTNGCDGSSEVIKMQGDVLLMR